MRHPPGAGPAAGQGNSYRTPLILALALLSLAVYAALAAGGDLRARLPLFFSAHVVLLLGMLAAWWIVRGDGRALRWAVVAALLFRIVAALGSPSLSDDVYRYVWDGRVQLHGVHPYRFAPTDPALSELRDEDWSRINHPELKTIYPPLSQLVFLALAAAGAGPTGFKLAVGLLDFGVVLALALLLRRIGFPRDRLILYAWNPLAILETAGSGHIEPLGVAPVVLAAAWIIDRRPWLSTLGLAGAVQAKLLPVVLLPGYARRLKSWELAILAAALVLPALPYFVWGGPLIGAGLFDYAQRWEHNAFLYPGIERALEWLDTGPLLKGWLGALRSGLGEGILPWDFLYRHVWPRDVARGLVLLAALSWIGWLTFRPRLDAVRETYLALGGVLLLGPTLHPWYVLWILPFAAAYRSRGWLLLAALVPLAYWSGDAGVPWPLRCIEYLPPLLLMLLDLRRRGRRGQDDPAGGRPAVC